MIDLTELGATELLTRLQEGRATAVELVEAHLARIEALNADLNALVTLNPEAIDIARDRDLALAQGSAVGPLHGLPVTIKDSIETAGLRTTAGYPPLKSHVPTRDAALVERIRRAGAIVLGKSNVSRLAADWQTDNPLFGRTANPWDHRLTPGGSSGGAAVAVASGMSPLDFGTDLGGSIRIPAHFCGIFGLKTTEGRVPGSGVIPDDGIPGRPGTGILHQSVCGPLARSVADLQLAFRVIAGPHRDDHRVAPVPSADLPALPDSLRLAFSMSFGAHEPDRATQGVLAAFRGRLESAGLTLRHMDPDPAWLARAWRAWGLLVGAELGRELPGWQRIGMRVRRILGMQGCVLEAALTEGRMLSVQGYLGALRARAVVAGEVDEILDGVDAWLCPVSLTPAIAPRRIGAAVDVDGKPVSYTA
ncbi:MAG: amidase, partial [Xanthomonadales bacterium]|nr:amidase [Xanthomonadales bacterium]